MATTTSTTKRWFMNAGAALALTAALASCAKQPTQADARLGSQPQAMSADGPGLHEAPTESFIEPSAPSRNPHVLRRGNVATLNVSSEQTLPALKTLIASANKSLWFETFNFGNDSMGKQIYPLLIAKAKSGVEVKVVMDYVGSRFLKGHGDMVKAMRAGGVDVRLYKPRFIIKDDKKRGINIMHRKIYMADGERALVGGVNLMAPFDTHTEDCLVHWRGPIVADIAAEFAFDYKASGGNPLPLPAQAAPLPDGDVAARVVVTSPKEGRYEGRDTIYAALDRAQKEIRISNQYLWDDGIIARLNSALDRGVKMRIVLPGVEDHGPWRALHADELKRLVDKGAEARLFIGTHPDAHLHTKYFGVDDNWVAIGSTNGDTRALMDNQEIDTVIENPRLAADFRDRMFQKHWTVESKPFVYVPGTPFTRPFRKLLEILDYYL